MSSQRKEAKPRSRNWDRVKRLGGRLLLIVVGLFIGLLICEVVLRLEGYSRPNLYLADWNRGVALRPGAEGWWTKEGRAYVRINGEGLRDREHSKAKPPNTARIAVLGDSYAEALQLPMEKTFWATMEGKLRECKVLYNKNVEVINFGVSGYGTAQELLTLREKVWDYSPDIVLLAVTALNDTSDNSRALKGAEDIPYFVFSNGRLVFDDSFHSSRLYRLRQSKLNDLARWFRDRSRLAQAINEVVYAISTRRQSRPAQESRSILAEQGIDYAIYQEPRDPIWSDAWRVTEALIVQMRNEVKEKGAKFFVVTLSGGPQVHPDPNVRQEFMKSQGLNDLFYPDLRIKALCEREAIPILALAPVLQHYAEQNKVFLHGFGRALGNGHWNESGHRVAGEMIAEWLCERLSG